MKRRNRGYNKHKKKRRDVMSRREGENQEFVSASVDGSHVEQG